MKNGTGDNDSLRDDTPNERPEATLSVHRPYVLALTAVIAPLHHVANTLSEVLHEIRIARDPVGAGTIRSIAEAGAVLENIGRTLREGFRSTP